MKTLSKKLISAFMTILIIFAYATTVSAAEKDDVLGYINGLPVRGKYDITVGERLDIVAGNHGVDDVDAFAGGNNGDLLEWDKSGKDGGDTYVIGAGVGVVLVGVKAFYMFCHEYYDEFYQQILGLCEYEFVETFYIIVVVHPEESKREMAELKDVKVPDIKVDYKGEALVSPIIIPKGDGDIYCDTLIVATDNGNAKISPDGHIRADKTGTEDAVLYSVDAYGNVFSSAFTVKVRYSFVQWLIRIFLFGWIWY